MNVDEHERLLTILGLKGDVNILRKEKLLKKRIHDFKVKNKQKFLKT